MKMKTIANKNSKPFLLLALIAITSFTVSWYFFFQEQPVDYNTEIKPLLNKKCISCHGGVKRTGGFSLLFQNEALEPTESGHPAIIPGNPEESEMIKRIVHKDPDLRMPPESPALSDEEIDLLTRWVEQGAPWGKHWAYKKVEETAVPNSTTLFASTGETGAKNWAKTDVDAFILARLKQEKLTPSPQVSPAQLARRVGLDVIGIPTPEHLLETYLENPDEKGYELLVDSLLASPKFGERWASMWLDLARYADSKGYEKDSERTIWMYRDWVINAFNQDMPFDQFTIEQLAGDLLPNPTDAQLIATGFHRNTMNNDEGGTDDEEFRVASVIDRTNTTMDVWMGTTFACVQCHSHPYDPFTHEEYYNFYAFFNNNQDADVPGEYPNLRFYSAEPDLAKVDSLHDWIMQHTQSEEAIADFDRFVRTFAPKIQPHSFDSLTKGALIDNKFLGVEHGGFARLQSIDLTDARNMIIRTSSSRSTGRVEIRLDGIEGKKIGEFRPSKSGGYWNFKTHSVELEAVKGIHDLYFVYHDAGKEGYVCSIEWLLFHEGLPGKSQDEYPLMVRKLNKLADANVDKTPILLENTPHFQRTTHVFTRGDWTARGKKVKPGVPASLSPLVSTSGGESANRLDLAKWLVNAEHPLTARVMVNRFWEQIFGIGLVETAEDFGTQGTPPSHPQLLDWLAYNFMHDWEWSMKKLVKELVMSSAYRQSSKVTPELLEIDPANRLLARGPRFRLSAEQVRDQALAVSGLLSDKMLGESVMPPQPEGIWQVIYSGLQWKTSEGEDRYRRALYTFWRRTSPYPSVISFDAPSREFCVPRRIRTNTPLQSLVTLNDPVYIEAAIALAETMLSSSDGDLQKALEMGFKKATFRDITPEKTKVLEGLYNNSLLYYQENDTSAMAFLNFPKVYDKPEVEEEMEKGEMEADVQLESMQPGAEAALVACKENCLELAAMAVVANAILNTDEFLTKQ